MSLEKEYKSPDMLATPNYAARCAPARRFSLRLLCLTAIAGLGFNGSAGAAEVDAKLAGLAARAQEKYAAARKRFLAEPSNAAVAQDFARVSFDRGDYATNSAERAAIAEQGITVSRTLVARNVESAQAHYYLGMNLGQLARTKTLGALRIVDEMEREFKMARALDERFDFAGPDRNLGLLYLDAPSFGSIGSRSKARQHLLKAVQLSPDYPENRLNLAEAYLKWGDQNGARRELKALETLWPIARTNFTGEAWAASWSDWEARLKRVRQKIEERAQTVETPRGRF